MILNALDEVLFWDEIPLLKNFIQQNTARYYPQDPERFYMEKDRFFRQHIPDKETFVSRLKFYSQKGAAIWVSGRNGFCDDIDRDSMLKAIRTSSQIENGQKKALQASKWLETNPDFWQYYAESILHTESNQILELTVGAGGGTNAVMRHMSEKDCYMGVDIDFVCAKNADALAKYYGRGGLGIAASLWNLPFVGEMFTSVCSNAGLEECREIPAILAEAARVLSPQGRVIFHCLRREKTLWYSYFEKYGFTPAETKDWLDRVRLYSDVEQVKALLTKCGLSLAAQKDDERLGHIIVFVK